MTEELKKTRIAAKMDSSVVILPQNDRGKNTPCTTQRDSRFRKNDRDEMPKQTGQQKNRPVVGRCSFNLIFWRYT